MEKVKFADEILNEKSKKSDSLPQTPHIYLKKIGN